MAIRKSFDAVQMKNRIQAELRRERRGKTDEQIRADRDEWIRTSSDPLAVWWRKVESANRRRKMAELREAERVAKRGVKSRSSRTRRVKKVKPAPAR